MGIRIERTALASGGRRLVCRQRPQCHTPGCDRRHRYRQPRGDDGRCRNIGRSAEDRMRNSVSEPPQPKLKLQPRDPVGSVSLSSSHLPVSDHPKIHSADQLGSVRLGGFHGGRSFFKVLVFDPQTTVPPITAASAPIKTIGSNTTAPMIIAKIKVPPAAIATFEIRMNFRQLLYNIGELLNVGFDVQDFFVQVTVVIHVKSTLSSPDPRVHLRKQKEIRPVDFGLWCVCPATSVHRPAATAQAASLTP